MSDRSNRRQSVSFYMPVEMHAELRALSRREGETMSTILRYLVARQLEAARGVRPMTAEKEARPCA